jgi:hypothetical protein
MYYEASKCGLHLKQLECDVLQVMEPHVTESLKKGWHILEIFRFRRLQYGKERSASATMFKRYVFQNLVVTIDHDQAYKAARPSCLLQFVWRGEFPATGVMHKCRRHSNGRDDSSVCVFLVYAPPTYLISHFTICFRPHMGAGRVVLPGQMIHLSVRETKRSGASSGYNPSATFLEHPDKKFWDALCKGKPVDDGEYVLKEQIKEHLEAFVPTCQASDRATFVSWPLNLLTSREFPYLWNETD